MATFMVRLPLKTPALFSKPCKEHLAVPPIR